MSLYAAFFVNETTYPGGPHYKPFGLQEDLDGHNINSLYSSNVYNN